jgi:hypothetical protein
VDSPGSGKGPVAGFLECDDEPSDSGVTDLESCTFLKSASNKISVFYNLFVVCTYAHGQLPFTHIEFFVYSKCMLLWNIIFIHTENYI